MSKSQNSINELVLRLKNGDKTAFEELYKLTSSKAYFVAFQISGDKHEAEDIVHESYLTVLAKINTLENTEGFMSWFNRIVANKSKDYLKKKKPSFFEEGKEEALGYDEKGGETFQPEKGVDQEELCNTVMGAVEKLNAEKRTCVLMKYFDDMSVNDIAQSLEIPVSTVKNRLFTARKELKALFEKQGLTAAYSIAPFGVVSWALNSSFETVAREFENSAMAAKILSGIAVAGTGAAVATVGTGTAAGATAAGAAVKTAGATALQKFLIGAVIAGVATGSTIGITSLVKTKTTGSPVAEEQATQTYEEPTTKAPSDIHNHIIEKEEEETVSVNVLTPTKQPKILEYIVLNHLGELKLGNNTINFDENEKRNYFYTDFYAHESGYYAFSQDCPLNPPNDRGAETRKGLRSIAFFNEIDEGLIDADETFITSNKYCVTYLEKGNHYPVVGRDEGIANYDVLVRYLGKEISDIEFADGAPEIIIGYNEDHSQITTGAKDEFCQRYNLNVSFTSGREIFLEDAEIYGFVEEGFKPGENTVVLDFLGHKEEKTIFARSPKEYVKDIELSNLEEFCNVSIGKNGFTFSQPENYTVTVTYGNGTKETFDGATWDKVIEFDDGTKLKVTFTTPYYFDREAARFSVCIGEVEYINELCTVKEIDMAELIKGELEYAIDVTFSNVNPFISAVETVFETSQSFEDYVYAIPAVIESIKYGIIFSAHNVSAAAQDTVITLYKICTENEFDLI